MAKTITKMMTDRGPDSAGFAIYRNPVDANHTKFTLACGDPETEWKSLDGDHPT